MYKDRKDIWKIFEWIKNIFRRKKINFFILVEENNFNF